MRASTSLPFILTIIQASRPEELPHKEDRPQRETELRKWRIAMVQTPRKTGPKKIPYKLSG